MAKRELVAEEYIPCPVNEVFDWVADFRHVPEVLEGVERWEPIGSQERGVEARYRVVLSLPAGLSASAVLQLTEWEESRAIAFETEDAPIRVGGRWTFKPEGDGTLVRLTISYQLDKGLGAWVAPVAEVPLRNRIAEAVRAVGQAMTK